MNTLMANDAFALHRPLLLGLAYRMLGSHAEAEDIVQETFLRWHSAPQDSIQAPRPYLAAVVTNLCLDLLKSARAQREAYVGPWLPEPVLTQVAESLGGARPDPDALLEKRQTLSLAFMVLLQRLSPVERAAYLLHKVFEHSHSEVAEILGKETAACRQLYHRAEQHLASGQLRFAPSQEEHSRLLLAFLQALGQGDLAALRALLSADAVAWSDGGGKVRAALKPIYGSDAVARLFLGLLRKSQGLALETTLAEVNGWPAMIVRLGGAPYFVLACDCDGQTVHGVYVILNPDKLRLAELSATA